VSVPYTYSIRWDNVLDFVWIAVSAGRYVGSPVSCKGSIWKTPEESKKAAW
jgi:hypothetical protein